MIEKKYKTFRNRFFAFFLDILIFLPFYIVADYLSAKNNISLLWMDLADTVIWTTYVVVGHGKYGQTVGKWLMNLKVMNIKETEVIGYKKAFYRESLVLILSLSVFTYFLFTAGTKNSNTPEQIDAYENLNLLFAAGWFVIEMTTMMLNKKRRALHDLVAGSVVVRTKYK